MQGNYGKQGAPPLLSTDYTFISISSRQQLPQRTSTRRYHVNPGTSDDPVQDLVRAQLPRPLPNLLSQRFKQDVLRGAAHALWGLQGQASLDASWMFF